MDTGPNLFVNLLVFALVLPLAQLTIFGILAFWAFKYYWSITHTVMTVVEEVTGALVEERETYRNVEKLLEKIERKFSDGR